jgi:hypothetical protein
MCNAKSFYDPAGFFGGGGDQLHAAIGLGVKPKTPDVVTRDPVAEEATAKTEAAKASNAAVIERKRRAKGSSLLAAGREQGANTNEGSPTLLAQGKTQLGG